MSILSNTTKMGNGMLQRDLDIADRGFFGSMLGSVSANFGMGQVRGANNNGLDVRSRMFMNHVVAGEGKGQWMFDTGNRTYRSFNTIEEGLDELARINGPSKFNASKGGWGAFNKARYSVGLGGPAGLPLLNVLGTGMSFFSGYGDASRQGEGFAGSVMGGGKQVVKDVLMGKLIYTAFTNPVVAAAAITVGAAASAGFIAMDSKARGNQYLKQRSLNMGGNLDPSFYSNMAATMRQRSVQSMNHSQFNAMRAIGNEAGFHHMAKSRYGSQLGAMPTPILGY